MTRLALALLAVASCVSLLYCSEPATPPPEAVSYEEYMNIIQAKLERRQQQELHQRDKRGVRRGHCDLFPLNLTITNEEECVGYIPLFACAGRCRTSETPHFYYSRQDANVPTPMISTCKCCSHTSALYNVTVTEVNLTCTTADNSTYAVTQDYLLLLPTDCSCVSCV